MSAGPKGSETATRSSLLEEDHGFKALKRGPEKKEMFGQKGALGKGSGESSLLR